MLLPEADLFPRSISVIGERKESLKPATLDSSSPSVDGGSKKKFKWNIKVGYHHLILPFAHDMSFTQKNSIREWSLTFNTSRL